ncbi:MAG TPA: DNA repair protein RecO [Dictyoglomaceae bacterium]|nr:DNA repair protein RecO [Dictyoglomaceae bacterium]HOL38918.1 DNA repair protein RecO [Dictyoglomaceae bacterium]HOP94894.1 DNA repair protein RecO [Dictyoglomaceae bacterium]HPP15665.1 DNA repair protein RecO [Dictyoglomaceae bacterium]HPU43381.1 DNA repair protein RecO [Dictyoglomaceae bacterium]
MGLENRYYYEEGIILNRKKVGDGDLLLNVYGKGKGKFWVKAPGALKMKNRLRGRVEVLTYGKGYFVNRKELDLLVNWQVYDRFSDLKDDLNNFFLVAKYIDLFNESIPLEVKDTEVFNLLLSFLQVKKVNGSIGKIFLLKIWQRLGFLAPFSEKCASCNKGLSDFVVVDFLDNKIFCKNCVRNGFVIPFDEIKNYNKILGEPFEKLIKEDWEKTPIQDEFFDKIKERIF